MATAVVVLSVLLAGAVVFALGLAVANAELEEENADLRRALAVTREQVRTFEQTFNGLCSCAEDIIQRRA